MTGPDPQIRIGYAERSAAQEALDQHLSAGRLDPHEYADRFAAAEVARTQAELDVLFTDLPDPRPRSGTGTRPTAAIGGAGERRDWYRYVPESVAGRIAALVAVAVAAIVVLPFVVVAVVLYFIVLPRITCGRRWSSGGPLWGGGGRPRDWLR